MEEARQHSAVTLDAKIADLQNQLLGMGPAGKYLVGLPDCEGDDVFDGVMLLNVHLDEVAALIWRVNLCVAQMNYLLSPEGRGEQGEVVNAQFFASVESLLEVCGRICAHVWPNDIKRKKGDVAGQELVSRVKARGNGLRALLGVDGDSYPCLSNRGFRNSIAHMDERLDEWFNESVDKNIMRNIISDSDRPYTGSSVGPCDVLSLFNVSSNCFWFRGDCYDIQKLCGEVDFLSSSFEEAVGAIRVFVSLHRYRTRLPQVGAEKAEK